ncbi:MAG: LysR family transcriptional regulator [Saprospiraceae bacterium]|nr:LysR family transcriptional regulator [Saprospiraceae bacterium]
MSYTLHQLRIFTKVCELQSVTKASEALFLTQPAISIQLKKLQDEFEIPLTEVIGRQLYITDFGKKIEKLALDILEKADGINSAADQYKGILTGQIKIASASTGKYVIPYFLTGFLRKYPGVNISIDVTNKTRVVENLQENSIDFAMISVLPDNLVLEHVPLIDNELHLVASAKYPGLPKRMTPKQLENYPLIFREDGSATRAAMKHFLNQNQIQVKRSMQLVSNEAVKQGVRAGLGLSIMPLIGVRTELMLHNIKIIPMRGLPIRSQWKLAYSSGKQLSPASLALLKYINENKEMISEEHFGKVDF